MPNAGQCPKRSVFRRDISMAADRTETPARSPSKWGVGPSDGKQSEIQAWIDDLRRQHDKVVGG